MPRRAAKPLEGAVKRSLAEIARRMPGADKTWEAELALRMAREVEDAGHSLTSRSMAADRLLSAMARLTDAAPEEDVKGPIDEIAARRKARRASA